MGGNFIHGALSGLVSCGLGESIGAILPQMSDIGQLAVVTIAGGTVSELGGGKFANGAMAAAFDFLFNQKWHESNQHDHSSDTHEGRLIAKTAFDYVITENKNWGISAPPKGFSKCNLFVQDILTNLGLYHGAYLTAGEWGNPNIEIDGWIQVPFAKVRCGDVAAYRYNTTNATGHMGILMYSSHFNTWTLIYAGSSSNPEVVCRSIFFKAGGQSWYNKQKWVSRHYVGK